MLCKWFPGMQGKFKFCSLELSGFLKTIYIQPVIGWICKCGAHGYEWPAMYDKPYMINPLCSLIRTFLVCGALGIFFFLSSVHC